MVVVVVVMVVADLMARPTLSLTEVLGRLLCTVRHPCRLAWCRFRVWCRVWCKVWCRVEGAGCGAGCGAGAGRNESRVWY